MKRIVKNVLLNEKYYYIRIFIFDLLIFVVLLLLSQYIPIILPVLILTILSYFFTYKFCTYVLNLINSSKSNANNLTEYDEKIYRRIFKNKYIFEFLIETRLNLFKETKKLNDNEIRLEIKNFMDKFSLNFIQIWYRPYISNNEEFLIESQKQLEIIFFDLFKRTSNVDKLYFFRYFAFVFNNNFINFVDRNLSTNEVDISLLHPALHRLPESEVGHIKQFVKIILSRSAPSNLKLDNYLIEKLLLQIIGKNCVEKLVDLISQPNFLYYSIVLLCNQKFDFDDHDDVVVDNLVNNQSPDQNVLRQKSKDDQISKANFELNDGERLSEYDKTSLGSVKSDYDENSVFIQDSKCESDSESSLNLNIDDIIEQLPSQQNEINNAESSKVDIIDIKICDTEIDYEPRSGDPFTLYIIQYTFKNDQNDEKMHTRKLRRRYKQFVDLHKRLKENIDFKQLIKNIEGPTNLFSLPIGNMDEMYIRKRKEKLNIYLHELIKIPEIYRSDELAVFLAFNENKTSFPEIKREKKISISSSIDNVLFRTVSGVFDKISSTTAALTSIRKSEDSNSNNNNDNNSILLDTGKFQLNYEYENSLQHYEFHKQMKKFLTAQIREENISSDLGNLNEQSDDIPPLSESIIEICIKLVLLGNGKQNCFINNENFYNLLNEFCSKYYLEKLLQEIIEKLFSDQSLIKYIHLLESVLFDKNSKGNTNKYKIYNYKLRNFALKCVKDLVPGVLKTVIGVEKVNQYLEVFFDSLKSPLLNRHFSYCILDLLLFNLYNE